MDEATVDAVEFRVALDEAISAALRIGDELAARAAAGGPREGLAELSARYMAARAEVHRIRRALTVEMAG